MAKVLSGSFNTTAYSNRYLTFSWTATQDTAKNQSTIKWSLKGAGSASGFYKAGNFKVVIAGSTVYESSTRIDLYNGTVVASGTKVITHNTNGSMSFSASAQAGIYTYDVNCIGSKSWDLVDIPRGATITSAPNFTDEEDPLISINNPANATTLAAIYNEDGTKEIIPYREFDGNSFQFMFDDADRAKLWAAAPTSNTVKVRFYVKSTIGTQSFWAYSTKTLTIKNPNPVIAPTVVDVGPSSLALTGNKNTMIRYFNGMSAEINATPQKGADIKSVKITNGSTTKTTYEAEFWYAESNIFTFEATDTRGNTTKETITRTPFIQYIKPTCILTKKNISTDGQYNLVVSGQCFNGSLGSGANTLTIQYRIKAEDGDWGDWTDVARSWPNHNYTVNYTITGLDYQKSYDIQARAMDRVAHYNATTDIITIASIPVFSWSKTDFEHNTNLVMDHNKTIFGKTADGDLWQVLEPCNNYGYTSLGWGSYKNSSGRTQIWGNDIDIRANNSVNINGKAYGARLLNTVGGGWWMSASQYVDLAEPISQQPNGILLVWSAYTGGSAKNQGWHTTYIPKYMIEQNPSDCKISTGMMCTSDFGVVGTKVLIITDTRLTGYDQNTVSGTGASGISYNNSYYVLRYVIGI